MDEQIVQEIYGWHPELLDYVLFYRGNDAKEIRKAQRAINKLNREWWKEEKKRIHEEMAARRKEQDGDA